MLKKIDLKCTRPKENGHRFKEIEEGKLPSEKRCVIQPRLNKFMKSNLRLK